MQLDVVPRAAVEFLRQTETSDPDALINEYVEYMLKSAGAWKLPVDLELVIRHHGFKQHTGPLTEALAQRGMLLGETIIYKSDDAPVIQRFTKAHELVEALAVALRSERPSRFSPDVAEWFSERKESWCERGAAEFLLPTDLFVPLVNRRGVRLSIGCELARDCEVSLTATMRRMLEANVAQRILLWAQEAYYRWRGAPVTIRGLLSDPSKHWKTPSRLHVARFWRSPLAHTTVHQYEPIPIDTSIQRTFQAQTSGKIEACNDLLTFRNMNGRYHVESKLVTIGKVPTVIALIHL
ncbi:MAG TPA: ImmA/IrrE family metallo-endopeptidase [Chloroflexia bacterium]|jgi:Zn-dependent peptidase ImmA (M78 family)